MGKLSSVLISLRLLAFMSWAKGKSQMNDLAYSCSSNGPTQATLQAAGRPAWQIYPAVMKLGLGPTTRSAVMPRPQVAAHSWMVLCNKVLPGVSRSPLLWLLLCILRSCP